MRVGAILAARLVLAGLALASSAGAGTGEQYVIELRLNGQEIGSALVVRRDADGTLLLLADDLVRLRLSRLAQESMLIDGERYCRLETASAAQVNFDEATLTAEVTLPASAFDPTRASYLPPPVPDVTRGPPGGFLNYDLSYEQIDGPSVAAGVVELGLFGSRGVITHSLAGRSDHESAGAVRLDTTWTRDFPERLATLRVGDSISSPGAWGRSARFGGIQFGTNFSTQPGLVTTPLLAASGEAIVPSTVDVFINGRQLASQDVPPGPFTIDRLPAVSGAGQMQVIVTDLLGRQQALSQPYYSGSSLLRGGLSEYSVELGSIRRDYASRSNAYGDLIGAATLRRGISDDLTIEAHAEAQAGGASAAGLDLAWQVGSIGILSGTAAIGGDGAGSGWLGGFGFERSGPRFSLFARSQYASNDFSQLGSASIAQQPKLRSFAGAGLNLRRLGSMQVLYALQSNWNAGQVETLGLSYSVAVGAAGFLNLYASQSMANDSQSEILLTWTLPLGERRSASSALAYTDEGDGRSEFRATATVQQNLPQGSGSGYYLGGSTDQHYRAGYSYQGSAGLAGIEYARRGASNGWRMGATGGLALTAAGILPARRLDQSFAVVQVADYEGLTVYVDNQPIGRTDGQGRVLLDGLRPYESNEISLDPAALPMDASISKATINLTPAYRSGTLLQFPVVRSAAITLRLVQPDGSPVPPGAQVELDGASFPVGIDGLAYLTEVSDSQIAVARWGGGHCRFEIRRPAGDDPIPDAGRIVCNPYTPAAPSP
jgi:outer membrane usher protein